jgi:hypothetical protein
MSNGRAFARVANAVLEVADFPLRWRVGITPNNHDAEYLRAHRNKLVEAVIEGSPALKARVEALRPRLADIDRRDARWLADDASPDRVPSAAAYALARAMEARLERIVPTDATSREPAYIARDSDGDRLTDRAERRLILDPDAADTDGDGLRDSVDPLPNIAYVASAPNREAMAAALRHILGPDYAISADADGSEGFARRQADSLDTLYLVVDPADLAGIGSDRRIVVLPPSLDLAKVGRNPAVAIPSPTTISLVMIGERYAQVVYGSQSASGTFVLESRNGVWHVHEIERWIT